MLTIYIDDSGTSPDQSVAVAAGWIAKTPAWTILEREWAKIQNVQSNKFSCMHMFDFVSEIKEFKGWDLDKKLLVRKQLTSLITKRAAKGFGLGVIKKDFDELVPPALRQNGFENHYTYAIRTVLGMICDWRKKQGVEHEPIEYIFDFMDLHNPTRKEITKVLTSLGTPEDNFRMYGLRDDGFNFKHKESLPPLQAADMLAWTIYRGLLHEIKEKDVNEIAELTFKDFQSAKNRTLLEGGVNTRADLIAWVQSKGLSPLVRS